MLLGRRKLPILLRNFVELHTHRGRATPRGAVPCSHHLRYSRNCLLYPNTIFAHTQLKEALERVHWLQRTQFVAHLECNCGEELPSDCEGNTNVLK